MGEPAPQPASPRPAKSRTRATLHERCWIGACRDGRTPACASVRTTQAPDTGDLVYTASESIPFPKGCFLEVQAQRVPEFDLLLTDAFPNTPWLFVYDEPDRLITSYLHKARRSLSLPHCLRSRYMYAPRAAQLHSNGGQFDPARSPARTTHGAYV